jgi:hypothetical protein
MISRLIITNRAISTNSFWITNNRCGTRSYCRAISSFTNTRGLVGSHLSASEPPFDFVRKRWRTGSENNKQDRRSSGILTNFRTSRHSSELAVFDALLYIRARRIDEPAQIDGVCGRSWSQLHMAHELAGALQQGRRIPQRCAVSTPHLRAISDSFSSRFTCSVAGALQSTLAHCNLTEKQLVLLWKTP